MNGRPRVIFDVNVMCQFIDAALTGQKRSLIMSSTSNIKIESSGTSFKGKGNFAIGALLPNQEGHGAPVPPPVPLPMPPTSHRL